MASLEEIVENRDVFQGHLLSYLTITDFVRLQSLSKGFGPLVDEDTCWEVLSKRDFGICIRKNNVSGNSAEANSHHDTKAAPEYNPHTKSFDGLKEHKTHKKSYKQWSKWQQQTCYAIKPLDMIRSIGLWARFEAVLEQDPKLRCIRNSLKPPPSRGFFECAAEKYRTESNRSVQSLPSSLVAFYAVHGGQAALTPQSSDEDFFAGMFGSYSCYDAFYSMRLICVNDVKKEMLVARKGAPFVVGMNLGNPRTFLTLDVGENRDGKSTDSEENADEGVLCHRYNPPCENHVVGKDGILSYFETYIERLEEQVYKACVIHPDSPTSLGICLFPETGSTVGVAVSRGIEVRASARWFPDGRHGKMNFGYSIRIKLVNENDSDDSTNTHTNTTTTTPVSYQLVDRNWEFHYEDGTVRRVSGEGAVGKQPILFRKRDGTTGYIDMGPAGTGETQLGGAFSYQSQSGPVPGTDSLTPVASTQKAHVRGSFGFRPGSIDAPTGPLFLVEVGEFPLAAVQPFY